MTQFHTAAQGMPDHIEKLLTALTRKLIWGSDSPPLPMSILNSPPNQGRRNIINIKYRNEAIYMMKLKRLFLSPPKRPVAVNIAVATIKACLPRWLCDLEETDPLI